MWWGRFHGTHKVGDTFGDLHHHDRWSLDFTPANDYGHTDRVVAIALPFGFQVLFGVVPSGRPLAILAKAKPSSRDRRLKRRALADGSHMVELRSPLRRSGSQRMIAGVCGGIAEWLGWDVKLVRVFYVLVSVFSAAFPGILAYIILWVLLPEESTG